MSLNDGRGEYNNVFVAADAVVVAVDDMGHPAGEEGLHPWIPSC